MMTFDLPETAKGPDDKLPENVFSLAAGQDNENVPELPLPDATGKMQPRGALSYTFARAIEGAADTDRDGRLRHSELWKYIRYNVRRRVASRQTPNLEPGVEEGDDPVLFQLAPLPPSSPPASGPARLAVISSSPVGIDFPGNVQVVGRDNTPDLIWDMDKKEVITALGDIVAYNVGDNVIGAVVDKWASVKLIGKVSAQNSLSIHVEPNDGYHTEDQSTRLILKYRSCLDLKVIVWGKFFARHEGLFRGHAGSIA